MLDSLLNLVTSSQPFYKNQYELHFFLKGEDQELAYVGRCRLCCLNRAHATEPPRQPTDINPSMRNPYHPGKPGGENSPGKT
ncbi:hypothetical protein HanRHA438_Chr13g0628151 [Helianthus annuus]|nr:hypothetical protein HanRHA438_Chr13g0628151 [Helianthus annuus]